MPSPTPHQEDCRRRITGRCAAVLRFCHGSGSLPRSRCPCPLKRCFPCVHLSSTTTPPCASSCRKLLEEGGFAVDTAETGRVGAGARDGERLRRDRARSRACPTETAFPLVQALRRKSRDTPVLVLTGNADKAAIVMALDAGADDYVTKPIDFDEFRARMRALVRRGGARRTEQLSRGQPRPQPADARRAGRRRSRCTSLRGSCRSSSTSCCTPARWSRAPNCWRR